ncbi:MAG: hypothetical protein ACI8Y3_000829 [Paraglaciecola sp.]|jgi:hypothetical protein
MSDVPQNVAHRLTKLYHQQLINYFSNQFGFASIFKAIDLNFDESEG